MASSSVSHSESHSDTYIPEYSETPILQSIALEAQAMSRKVYEWGIDRFNKMQGDIDGLMRDALSYASPQRIAVDMGQAEAGVMQAGERGRLSAIRDLESYGIDPSSGRYAALDSANRVMTAAAAAGAGNQQRMASQAAGNAMRNQAIAAGLQNANFGLGVGDSANRFLNTASQLKYPPLGRYSDSVSDSASGSTDGGGGSKPAKEDKPPPQQQEKPPPQAKPPAAAKPAKAQPTKDKPEKNKPKEDPDKPEDENWKERDMPDQGRRQPELRDPDLENMQPPPLTDPDLQNMQPPPLTDPDLENMQPPPLRDPDLENMQPPVAAETPTGMDMEFDPWKNVPDATEDAREPVPTSDYDPYAGNLQRAAFEDNQGQIDPVTGEPIETTEDTGQDVAGSLYGLEGGDWTLEGAAPTAADWGGTQTADFGDAPEGQTWDSALDTWTDDSGAQFELGDYQEPAGEEPIDVTDTGGDNTGDFTFDYGDQGDQGDFEYDYGDQGDYEYDYGDEGDYDYGDEGDYDYGDEGDWDYDTSDEGDYDYEDYADEGDEGDWDYEDYEDTSSDDESVDVSGDDEDVSWGDDGDDGGDYARGGPVRGRRRMRPGGRPRPPMQTGFQQQRPRLDPPPQPPRPPRGAPMPARGGPRPPPMGRGMGGPGAMAPGNFISANGMPPPVAGGAPRPQMMARGGPARGPNPEHATSGGFVSRELSPSGGSKVDDVQARLNAEEFVIPKDVAMWKGKEFFYKMIAQARKNRSGEGAQNSPNGQNNSPRPRNNSPRPRTGYGAQR